MQIMMNEFGSDFHYCDFPIGDSLQKILNKELCRYVSGRQALMDLAYMNKYKTIYVPSYFCQDVINTWYKSGINIKIYEHTPLNDINLSIEKISPQVGEAIFISNYFGINIGLNYNLLPVGCEIIEDHTHDITSDESIHSSAAWCIASLRKSTPIAEGGILWSPQGYCLPTQKNRRMDVEQTICTRYHAMKLKSEYLSGGSLNKDLYLSIFKNTESEFSNFPISDYGSETMSIIENLDIVKWDREKFTNWKLFLELIEKSNHFHILGQNDDVKNPFSLILYFNDKKIRDCFRKELIHNNIYPAILWDIPSDISVASCRFSERMLSIHCDGRYKSDDIKKISQIINHINRTL